MREGWLTGRLEDWADLKTGFPFKSAQYVDEPGIRLVRGDNVVQQRIRWDGVKYWPSDDLTTWSDFMLAAGDVLLAMDRPWIEAGLKASRVSPGDVPSLLVQRVCRLRAKESLDQGFLAGVVQSRDFTEYVKNVQTGTAVPHISAKQILGYSLAIPPLDEQRRIAGVLGALDDLIDTNQRLADAAQDLATAIAARAPDQVALAGLAENAAAKTEVPTGVVDHFSLPAFDAGQQPEVTDGCAIKSNKIRLNGPTVLISRLNPHIPRVWIAYSGERPALASTEFVTLVGREGVTAEEVWAVTATTRYTSQMAEQVTGTTGSHQRVAKQALLKLRVPDVRGLDESHRTAISVLIADASACRDECSRLRQTRDELLPLLMSGAVSPGDVAVAS